MGALKKVKLVRPGTAEIVFHKKDEAMSAIRKYHMRELDGKLGYNQTSGWGLM